MSDEIIELPKKRGRPTVKGTPMTPAERKQRSKMLRSNIGKITNEKIDWYIIQAIQAAAKKGERWTKTLERVACEESPEAYHSQISARIRRLCERSQ